MILKSLRVQNFKCIDDSGEFSIEPITCLVGKNESGKTALLQALYKLNPVVPEDGQFLDTEYPRRRWAEYKARRDSRPDNVLTTVWELEPGDRAAVSEALGEDALAESTVKVCYGYDNTRRYLLDIDEKRVVIHLLGTSGLDPEDRAALEDVETVVELREALEAVPAPSPARRALLTELATKFEDGSAAMLAIKILDKRLPKFVYFDEYYQLPGQVAVDDLLRRKAQNSLRSQDRVFLALLDLAGSTTETITSLRQFEPLVAELEAVSNRLSEEMVLYWSQNRHLEVEFRFDAARPQDPPPFNTGYIFRTRIRNTRHRVSVGFDERSSGFIWFFSFLIWFSQVRKNYGRDLILLLDEPAIGLHARAQADLVRYMNEELKRLYQVIYTTHSSFMIDPKNMSGTRTVEDVVVGDTPFGTKVGDEVLSTDRDTVFPLQAALVHEITRPLVVGPHVLLVHCPSDLLYLRAFCRELQSRGRTPLDPRWVITPMGGLEKVSSFLAIFNGNEGQVAALNGFHEGQKKKVRDLKESDLLKVGHVFSVATYADQDEADVEDLLGRHLYVDLVRGCYGLAEAQQLPKQKPAGAPARLVKEVENHFARSLPQLPGFNPYLPAAFLVENARSFLDDSSDVNATLDRFEDLFVDLNAILPRL